jgi:hypothetical protein
VTLRAALGVFALWALGCTTQTHYPGSEVMGTFVFQAFAVSNTCVLPNGGGYVNPTDYPTDAGADGGFSFQGTFSRNPGTTQVWFTLGGNNWPATFDGQDATAVLNAQRRLAECSCGSLTLVETIDAALLSSSQSLALGGACPPNPLDGGIPPSADAGTDAGIVLPGTTPSGFDAVLACGTLSDAVDVSTCSDAGPDCFPCSWNYFITGLSQ